ncbi:MAG: hypothetical protein KGL40_05700 [Rhodocyclaceae bacterium]|nr:hypothetical protein [Rhodocyclaceae bacterium]
MSRDTNRDHVWRASDEDHATPGQPLRSNMDADDKLSGHERQVHHRNYSGKGPGRDGYVGVPPGEEGQYGMRRSGASVEPWYNDVDLASHSADEHDSHYARWRKDQLAQFDADYTAWKKERSGSFGTDFDEWRRKQTAPGTNVGSPVPDKQKDK